MSFRSDINGLRAIAVLAVVLFHFKIPGFSGGFVGVDIFFVISGYLMTSIIFTKLYKQEFSLLEFYIARARRIVPALIALCTFLLILLSLLLPPSEFIALGKQVVSSLTFLSNIFFWQESGYFDSAAHEKWLLHTWSLALEWQFYILFPLMLVILHKLFPLSALRWLLLGAFICSFVLSAWLPTRWADAGFFLLPTRAWELITGGLIFLFPVTLNKPQSRLLQASGLALILASLIWIEPTNQWPSWEAAIPVMGASLLIYAHNAHSRITGNRVMQYFGTISYSYYLWHWPAYVALVYFNADTNALWLATSILGSLLIATLSYRYIEQPIRIKTHTQSPAHLPWPKTGTSYSLIWALITISGAAIILLDGVPTRLDPIIVMADHERHNKNPRQDECNVRVSNNPESPQCIFGNNKDKVSLIVMGDSHANATINAVAEAFSQHDGGVLYLGADGCTYIHHLTTSFFPACTAYNEKITQLVMEKFPKTPILVINRITASLIGPNEITEKPISYINNTPNTAVEFAQLFNTQYINTLCSLTADRELYILDPIPEMGINVPQTLIKNKMFEKNNLDVSINLSDYEKRHAAAQLLHKEIARHCGATILDPTPYLCNKGKCWGSINGRSLYYDDDHLSEYGNRLLVPLFAQIAKKAIATH